MADAIIARRKGSSSGSKGNLVTKIITANEVFVVPKAYNNQFDVRIFGGGGGGGSYVGGGGGWMNNATLTLQNGTSVVVTIGAGGTSGSSGSTTTFGTYLSANGGGSGGSGSSTRNTGIDVMFKIGQDAYLGVLMIDDSSSS